MRKYGTNSAETEITAIREITQELILFALSTSDFFSHAAFQGGTCLRIVHGLSRFSEDMDFILKERDTAFSWQQYLALIGTTLEQYGYNVELQDTSHADDTVKKAFIKDDSIGKVLRLAYANRQGLQRKIRIKLEIDSNPPGGGEFESAFIGFPAPSSITVETLSTLFAGKSHALLCRTYEKGRDWYDFLWYLGKKRRSIIAVSPQHSTRPARGKGEASPLTAPGTSTRWNGESARRTGSGRRTMSPRLSRHRNRASSPNGARAFSCPRYSDCPKRFFGILTVYSRGTALTSASP